MISALAVLTLLVLPSLPFLAAADRGAALGVALEAVAVVALGRRHPRIAGLVWALTVTYGLIRAGSRVGTHQELPLYDLALLTRPLVVVGADLFGAWAYLAALVALASPLVLVALGVGLCRRLPDPSPALWAIGLVALPLPGTRSLGFDLAADVLRSARLASELGAELRARPHTHLAALDARDVDVLVYVVESYGDVVTELPGRWEPSVLGLDGELRARGWVTASGWSMAPVQGGRSWISDASVLTGLHLDSQSNYERATAMAADIPTLPGWFAARGFRTVLVRPSDRVRPGVRHENRFAFQHTLFFDDLGYTGPAYGWGYVPDQYSLHVAHRDLIDGQDVPTFAFFHLCTSHLPWSGAPPVVDDPMSLQTRPGSRDRLDSGRTTMGELVAQLRRFRSGDQEPSVDRSAEARNYVAMVLYDLRVIVNQLGVPERRPRLVVIYGDHQPAFLARGRSARVPVHLVTDDATLLAPFLAAGFQPGWVPRGGEIEHRDLFDLVARAVAR